VSDDARIGSVPAKGGLLSAPWLRGLPAPAMSLCLRIGRAELSRAGLPVRHP